MAKSLADLLAAPSIIRPSTVVRVVLGEGQKYLPQMQAYSEEHDRLLELAAAEEKRPRKATEKPATPARVAQLRDLMADLSKQMADYEGDLTVTAVRSDGEWAEWKIANPARTGEEPGARDDIILTGAACNSDALLADLATYVTAWEGEPLQAGNFDALNVTRPDKKTIAVEIIRLYEVGGDVPKLLNDLSAYLQNAQSSQPPAISG